MFCSFRHLVRLSGFHVPTPGFTVIISLLPLGFSAFKFSRQGQIKTNIEIFRNVLSKGDILIVGVVIKGDGIGEIIATSKLTYPQGYGYTNKARLHGLKY
ncbi:hypothetical protein AsFPU1_3014 [Aphanothece sacrum FPU1]|uniref:Uncharacterized protein n=1 Tax=Aphanothece sacrum FPU1 TaxID=1920663 RepID=A0A401IK49_APHSA|nr:hypothetical protein AsFPU1_3014 [Aphanothece sacrum FPU1]GBF84146.1 hypothetical protein AsFPU3_1192 [Aphanothece sacrum FPU3]